MPVYNGGRYLSSAFESILNQTFTDFEFIAVNDGSTDRTAQILDEYKDPRIRVLHQTNCGLACSLNRGIRESSGEYIARMDADDISEPDRLSHQMEFLNTHPDYVLVGTNALMITQDGVPLCSFDNPTTDKNLRQVLFEKYQSPFVHGSVMFRRNAAFSCGLYDEGIRQDVEDLLLWRAMARTGKVANLPQVLYRYRIVPGGITAALPRKAARQKLRIIQKIVNRNKITEQDRRKLTALSGKATPFQRQSCYELKIGKIYQKKMLNHSMARHHFARAVRKWPSNVNAWGNLLFSCFPIKLILGLKSLLYEKDKRKTSHNS